MPKRGRLRIDRKGYTRKKHLRREYQREGVTIPQTEVKKSKVPRTTFSIKDVGAPGRSMKPRGVPELKKGRMTHEIEKALGYTKHPTDLTPAEWKKVFGKSMVSGKAWLGMLGTQVARRKYAKPGEPRYADKMAFEKAINILADVKDVTPRKAIKTWQGLSPRERAKRMPGGAV